MLSLAAALALSALHPATPVVSTALAQKIQVIKGKKGTVKPAAAEPGSSAAPAPANAAKEQELVRKAAELDARNKALEEREQALNEKESAHEESQKKQADKKAKQQKAIEKIGEQNEEMMRQAADALAGD